MSRLTLLSKVEDAEGFSASLKPKRLGRGREVVGANLNEVVVAKGVDEPLEPKYVGRGKEVIRAHGY